MENQPSDIGGVAFPEPVIRPWICSAELKYVCDLLYSEDIEDQCLGASVVTLWCQRTGQFSVPRGALLTSELVTALNCKDLCAASSAQSLALTRFVTLASGEEQDRSKLGHALPVHSTAKAIGIPQWLVNARHDIVHGQLPGSCLVQSACEFALDWLKDRFWLPSLSDLESSALTREQSSSLLCSTLQSYFDEVLQSVSSGHKKITASKSPSLYLLQQHLFQQKGGIYGHEILLTELLSERCLFMTTSALKTLDSSSHLSSDFARIWLPLFKLLHEFQLLTPLVEATLICHLDTEIMRAWAYFWLVNIRLTLQNNGNFPLSKALGEIRVELNWTSIFNHLVVDRLSEDVLELVNIVIEVYNPAFSNEEKTRIKKLNDLFLCAENIEEDVEEEEFIQDPVEEEEENEHQLWSVDSCHNWSKYPIGTAPSYTCSQAEWKQILV